MKARDLVALLALAAVWGGSFLFIRVAAPAVGPVVLATVRVALAGFTLLLYASAARVHLEMRRRWASFLVVGILNNVIPYTAIAVAELHLSSGLAAILNATTPLFGAVVSVIWMRDTLGANKVVGLIIGFSGVVALTLWSGLPLTAAALLAVGASLLGALSYGIAGVYARRAFAGVSPITTATGQLLLSTLVLAPIAVPVAATTSPWTHLTAGVVWAIVALAIAGTSAAYIVYFRLIATVGAVPAMSVTFLVPAFGLLWGALFLHERITLGTFGGMAIIFAGVLLVMGLRLPRRARAAESVAGAVR